MKTKVKIKNGDRLCMFAKGCEGYIDGYLRAEDNCGYAVVVSGKFLDFVPFENLEVIYEKENKENVEEIIDKLEKIRYEAKVIIKMLSGKGVI